MAWSHSMPYPSSPSRPTTRQPLLFTDSVCPANEPDSLSDAAVARCIVEDRERLLKESRSAEPKFELKSSDTKTPRQVAARELPDRCMQTAARRRDEFYEARVRQTRGRLETRPLLAFFDAA